MLACVTAVAVLSRREQIQSSGRSIIMTSARRSNSGSRPGGARFSVSDDEDQDDELYNRYIASWRPDVNDSRSSRHDSDSAYERQPVKIAGVPRVSQMYRDLNSFVL